jgi:hypothetical protein
MLFHKRMFALRTNTIPILGVATTPQGLFARYTDKAKSASVPVFSQQDSGVPVIRQDVASAYTLQQSKKALRSSGLEK